MTKEEREEKAFEVMDLFMKLCLGFIGVGMAYGVYLFLIESYHAD